MRVTGGGAAHARAGEGGGHRGSRFRTGRGGAGPPAAGSLISAAAAAAAVAVDAAWGAFAQRPASRFRGEEEQGRRDSVRGKERRSCSRLRRWTGPRRTRRKEEGPGWGGGLRLGIGESQD